MESCEKSTCIAGLFLQDSSSLLIFPPFSPPSSPSVDWSPASKAQPFSELSLVGSWSTAPFSVWFLGGLVDWFFCSCLFWGLCSAAVTSLSNSVFLSQSPKCWDYRQIPPCLTLLVWLWGFDWKGQFFEVCFFVLFWDGISYLWMTLSSDSPLTCGDRLLPLHLLYLVLLG